MWHWQQYYFLTMWSIVLISGFISVVMNDIIKTRLLSLTSIILASFGMFVLWSAGFFG